MGMMSAGASLCLCSEIALQLGRNYLFSFLNRMDVDNLIEIDFRRSVTDKMVKAGR